MMIRGRIPPPHDLAGTFLLEQFFVAFVTGAVLSTWWAHSHLDSTMYAHVRLPGVISLAACMGLSVLPSALQFVLSSLNIVAFTEILVTARSAGLALLFGSAMATAGVSGAFWGQFMGRTVAFATVAIFAAIAFLRIQLVRRSD